MLFEKFFINANFSRSNECQCMRFSITVPLGICSIPVTVEFTHELKIIGTIFTKFSNQERLEYIYLIYGGYAAPEK